MLHLEGKALFSPVSTTTKQDIHPLLIFASIYKEALLVRAYCDCEALKRKEQTLFSNLAGLQFFTALSSLATSYQKDLRGEERKREGWTGNPLLRQTLSAVPNTETDRRLLVHARQGADTAGR